MTVPLIHTSFSSSGSPFILIAVYGFVELLLLLHYMDDMYYRT